MMYHDEIIVEVWRNRDTYAARHGHDLAKIVADLQRRQKNSQDDYVDLRDRTRRSSERGSAIAPPRH